jgi:hypothetical protein
MMIIRMIMLIIIIYTVYSSFLFSFAVYTLAKLFGVDDEELSTIARYTLSGSVVHATVCSFGGLLLELGLR